jgi:hypothetical protein
MRTLILLFAAGIALISLVAIHFDRRARTKMSSGDDVAIAELRRDVEALRYRERLEESVHSAVRERPELPPPASTSTTPETATASPPTLPTQQEMVATFRTYFKRIDDLRGTPRDDALAATFDEVLSNEWRDKVANGPIDKALTCGNGYCRMSLTFKDLLDAAAARSKLALSLARLSSGMSLFLDPGTRQLEGYFATGEKTLPSFPGTGE